ncbi:MAG: hypothetical protein AAFO07_04925 [Bacteroidota bacterium]
MNNKALASILIILGAFFPILLGTNTLTQKIIATAVVVLTHSAAIALIFSKRNFKEN